MAFICQKVDTYAKGNNFSIYINTITILINSYILWDVAFIPIHTEHNVKFWETVSNFTYYYNNLNGDQVCKVEL